jgi:hypothetical protein
MGLTSLQSGYYSCDNHHQVYRLDEFLFSFTFNVIDFQPGFKGFLKIFENLGTIFSKISYGIYLYHLIAALFFWKFLVIRRSQKRI